MKKIYKSVVMIIIVVAVGFTTSSSFVNDFRLSNLQLNNVEALAGDELDAKIWERYDYTLDNGHSAVNCIPMGSDDCRL